MLIPLHSVVDGAAVHRHSVCHAIHPGHYGGTAASFGADSSQRALPDYLSLRSDLPGNAACALDLDDRLGVPTDPNRMVWGNDCPVAYDLVVAG